MDERTDRRAVLRVGAAAGAGLLAGCSAGEGGPGTPDPSARVPDADGWRSFANDAANTGATGAPGPAAYGVAVWREPPPGEPTGRRRRFASPLVAGTAAYVLSPDGSLRALSLSDGSRRWERTDAGFVTPAVADGTLYYRALRGERSPVVAVDVATDATRWERDLPRLDERGGVTVAADTAYVTGGPAPVVALAREDGAVRWTADGPASVGAAALANDRLFVTTRQGLAAYDAATGERRWRRDVASRDAPSVADGRAFVGTDGAVRVFDADGEDGWTADVDGEVRGTPAVAGGTVVAATTNGTVHALAVEDGAERWRTAVGGAVNAPVAVADGTVHVPTHAESVVALSLDDGTERWRTWLRFPVPAALAVADGRVLVRDAGDRATLLEDLDGGLSFPDVGAFRTVLGDASNTNRLRTASLRSTPAPPSVAWRSPIAVPRGRALVADGRVFLGDSAGLYALSAASGHLDWRVPVLDPAAGTSVCAVAGGSLLAGADGALHAFDLAPDRGDGGSRWEVTLPNGSEITAATVVDGTAYVTAFNAGEVAAVDVATGEVAWSTARLTGFSNPPAVTADRVYTGPAQGMIVAIDRATGEILREEEVSPKWSLTPVVLGDDRAYVATKKGVIYGYELPSLEFGWRAEPVETEGRNVFRAPPALAGDRLYFASTDGSVHALDTGTGDEVATADLPAAVQAAPRIVGDALLVGTWKDPGGARLLALDREDLSERWSVTVFDEDGTASIGSIAPVDGRIVVSGSGVAMLE